jgi:hypothetical protein
MVFHTYFYRVKMISRWITVVTSVPTIGVDKQVQILVKNWKTTANGYLSGILLGFDSQQGLEIFLFTTESRTAPGPIQPPIQWVPGALSLGVKQLGHEADNSPPSSAKVKE